MKYIIFFLILLFYVVLVSGYTAPDFDNIDLVLDIGYTAPDFDNINLVLDLPGNPDTNCTIWDGSNWIPYVVGEYPEFRCTPTQTNCEPTNQNVGSSQSIFKICNNGTIEGTSVYMNMNITYAGIDLFCDDDYIPIGAITLNESNQTIHGSLAADACTDVSCWVNYSNPTSGGYFGVNTYVIE